MKQTYILLGRNMSNQSDYFGNFELVLMLSYQGTTCRTLWSGTLGTARPRKWRTLETTRSFNFVLIKKALTKNGDILLKSKFSVPKHDLRERGPGVDPGDPASWAGLRS